MSEPSQDRSEQSALESLLLAIEGVESVFIEESHNAPISTSLRLAQDADEQAVARAVSAVLGQQGLRTRNEPELEAEGESEESQTHVQAQVDSQGSPTQLLSVSPARVASAEISQTSQGLRVSVTLTDGRAGEQVVEPGGDHIRMAVVAIVGVLLGVVGARLTQYKVEEFAGRRAVTVIIERGSHGVGVGTAFESGTVFEPGTVELAIARATWAAILG